MTYEEVVKEAQNIAAKAEKKSAKAARSQND